MKIRKNARLLSTNEREALIEGLKKMKRDNNGAYNEYAKLHNRGRSGAPANEKLHIHNAPVFLPWHRALLLDLERELQNIETTYFTETKDAIIL